MMVAYMNKLLYPEITLLHISFEHMPKSCATLCHYSTEQEAQHFAVIKASNV